MKERPILFSAPMVRAILAGQKMQTRRIAKPVKHPDLGNLYGPGALVMEREPQHVINRACPYGKPGDRLWVRETWAVHPIFDSRAPRDIDATVTYAADCQSPSILIVSVRVERLQDITEADAQAEGAEPHPSGPLCAFSSLWRSINGVESWVQNPWVWVVEFRRIEA